MLQDMWHSLPSVERDVYETLAARRKRAIKEQENRKLRMKKRIIDARNGIRPSPSKRRVDILRDRLVVERG